MAKDKRFELPPLWRIGNLAIVPTLDPRLGYRRDFTAFEFVPQNSAKAERWRHDLEIMRTYNPPSYWQEVQRTWAWFNQNYKEQRL